MRALAAVLAVLTIVAAVAAESAAAAAVGGSFAGTPGAAISHWTPARRAAAEPMPALPLSPTGKLVEVPTSEADLAGGSRPTSSATASVAPTGPIEGIDTGSSTLFPNRANGIVLGVYGEGPEAVGYQCSGSVINSPAGDVVLTAGHCVIDAETGEVAHWVVFIPGYREKARPYGTFAASSWVTTPEWSSTAGATFPNVPDEAGDLAMLVLAPDTTTGQSVEATVGALSIAFEQPREQTYTQWGYPGVAPYPEGEILYSHTTPYEGADPFYPLAVAPIKIASDFTEGASGGPRTIGPTSAPTVLSLTDYFYPGDPRHLYGAYFGSAARQAYEAAAGVVVPPVTTAAPTAPAVPAPETPAATPAATPPPAPSPATGSLRILASHVRSTHGQATVVVHVGGPGKLRLSGAAVRTVSAVAEVAGNYRLPVSAKAGGAAARALLRRGRATVGIWVRFAGPIGVRHASRLVRLVVPR